VTVVIVSTTVVAVLFGLATAINLSRDHREDADTAVVLTAAADAVKAAPYVACPAVSTGSYDATTGVGLPPDWAASAIQVLSVQAWTGTGFGPCPASDLGLQLVKVEVTTPDGRATRQVDVVKRAAT
jgi:hypothetical protein